MAIDRDGDGPSLRREEVRPSKAADELRASPFTEDVFDDEYYGRRRRGGGTPFGMIAGVVFVAAIVAAAAWYVIGVRSGISPAADGGGQVVKADDTPYKVKPDDPGGMQVDNQDKMIYDRVAKGAPPSRVENLLPAPEEPHAPPVQAAPKAEAPPSASSPADQTSSSSDDSLAKLVARLSAEKSASEKEQVPAAAPPSAPAVQVAEAGSAPPPPPLPTTSSASAVPANAQVIQPAAPASTAAGSPMLLVPADTGAPPSPSSAPATVAVTQAPAPVTAATPAAAPAAASAPVVAAQQQVAAAGGVSIQLASARSEDAALSEWKRISGKNSDLLANLSPTVMQAEVPDKGTFFRLRAGPLADRPAAESLCGALAARNVSCIVVRP